MLAFSGTLAILAHLSGRTYRDTHGTRTNLYLIALGDTGIGKNEPRRVNRRLAEACGAGATIAEAIASGEALEENILRSPSLLLQADEVETIVAAMHGSGKNAQGLSDRMRRFFTASAGAYSLRATASTGEGAIVHAPHLTLFGTGVPDEFYDALDQHAVRNGLFGRCLVVKAEDEYRANLPTERFLPPELVKTARALVEQERRIDDAGVLRPIVVAETPEAAELLRRSSAANMALRKRLAEADLPSARALVKHFVGLLAKNGGSLDRRTLMRKLHVDHGMFKRITLTLHMCDMIDEERLDARKFIYTLKKMPHKVSGLSRDCPLIVP